MNPVIHDLQRGFTVKALSWKEPYGSLMLPPYNKIETRTWDTSYRGLVLICCSKKQYSADQVINISGNNQFARIAAVMMSGELKTNDGMAIAIGRLIDCRLMGSNDTEKTFTLWYPHTYCHVYTDVTPIVPFPWKGSQGWRTVPKSIIDQIKLVKLMLILEMSPAVDNNIINTKKAFS